MPANDFRCLSIARLLEGQQLRAAAAASSDVIPSESRSNPHPRWCHFPASTDPTAWSAKFRGMSGVTTKEPRRPGCEHRQTGKVYKISDLDFNYITEFMRTTSILIAQAASRITIELNAKQLFPTAMRWHLFRVALDTTLPSDGSHMGHIVRHKACQVCIACGLQAGITFEASRNA